MASSGRCGDSRTAEKSRQFLVHQVAGRTFGQLHAGHRRVVAVSGAEGVIDVDVGEPGQRRAEGFHVFRVGLDLGDRTVGAGRGGFAFFLDMETKVLEQDDFAGLDLRACGLDFRPDTVGKEGHRFAEKAFESGGNRRQAVLRHDFPVGAPEVRHENDGCTLVQGILDRRQCGLDALGVGNGAADFVLGDVEVNADQGALAFEGEIFNEQFGHDFLDSEWVLKKAGIRIENSTGCPCWLHDDSSAEHFQQRP
jgi:hypothetical protein